MTKNFDTAYTTDEAEEYDVRRFSTVGGKAVHDVEYGHVARFLDRYGAGATSSVLEVGCGTGRLLDELPDLGKVTGLDLSAPMLDQARSLLASDAGIELVEGNAADMAFSDDEFDLVYSVRLLNRVGTKDVAKQIVCEIERVASPGAKVLIEMTNASRKHRGMGTVAFTRSEFSTILADAQLDELSVEGAFVLGIGPWTNGGERFLTLAKAVDKMFAKRFPALCARIYFTAQTRAS